jgi:hypothetical protein
MRVQDLRPPVADLLDEKYERDEIANANPPLQRR